MSDTTRRRKVSAAPGLRVFLEKVITPVVLLAGLLLLVFFNFNALLKAAKVTNTQFENSIGFSQGPFNYSFQENAGLDRPVLSYAQQNLLTYSEWGSTASVDGSVQELWNTTHGYDSDQGKRQVYSTMTGNFWSLSEIITLVDDHTVTVTFTFVARPFSLPGPSLYIFDIAHTTNTTYAWYDAQVKHNTFSGQVILLNGGNPSATSTTKSFGTISLTTSQGDIPQKPTMWLKDPSTLENAKENVVLAQQLFTEYQIKNPSPGEIITLGTETLTFHPGSTQPGAPLSGSAS